ncbi:hypothetical protein [Salinibacter ruber]|uniref:hypothetical protein n=1 Tax=Salinibacter ruber TaxID=146919 RepID=UPI002167627A|nr:hypothetical protein [Salinibacter ruber]MCS3785433.1 hypothetical protein [Salinibacter ruber]
MGQQQLLLLVLSTVIVGLATVAGIQAFGENQKQATQDALVQRAMSIGSDIAAAARQPSQMGGIKMGDGNNTADDKSNVASAIGLSSAAGISADGAGDNAACKINAPSSGSLTLKCDDDAGGSGSYDSGQTVTVTVDPDANNPVEVTNIKVTS